jgi:hypothetical protein
MSHHPEPGTESPDRHRSTWNTHQEVDPRSSSEAVDELSHQAAFQKKKEDGDDHRIGGRKGSGRPYTTPGYRDSSPLDSPMLRY